MILLEPQFVNRDLKIAFGTRKDKIDTYKEPVLEYIQLLSQKTGIKRFILMQQVHKTHIREVGKTRFKKYKEISYFFKKNTDAIWTKQNNIALCIKTADCMPVFISAENLIAAIHMGWRGARDRIVEKFINTILLKKHINPKSIRIICGPHIRECCYSVGKELIDEFEVNGYKQKDLFIKKGRGIYLSLESAIYIQAQACNIAKENITTVKICTYCLNTIFYSYRRGDVGRNISFIIKNNRL